MNSSNRMRRYDEIEKTHVKRRTDKNKDLYQNTGMIKTYTNLTDVPPIEAVELTSAKKNYRTREGYHQMKDYHFADEKPLAQKELEDFNSIYQMDENKNHDINTILKEARELRERDELERKRKLHNEKYNILQSSEEELEKFKQETNKTIKPVANEEELEELIHTITSKELREEIDKEQEKSLLSDLMATSVNEEIVTAIKQEVIEENKKETPIEKPMAREIDSSFYTRSMDLTEEDFYDEKIVEKAPKWLFFVRLLFSLLLIIAVGIGVYYIINNF